MSKKKSTEPTPEQLVESFHEQKILVQDCNKRWMFHYPGKGYLSTNEIRLAANELDRLNNIT